MSKYCLLFLMFLLGFAQKSTATPELRDYRFVEENIEVTVTIRYWDNLKELHYKALTKNLNEFTSALKAQGKLDKGKVKFEIMDAIWMDKSTSIQMYRHAKGYYCATNALLQPVTETYLRNIIRYFASENWKSFCYDNSKVSGKTALSIFNQILFNQNSTSISESPSPIIVKQLKHTNVTFSKGNLSCTWNGKNLGIPKYFLPFSHQGLDFLCTNNTIQVIKENETINSITLTHHEFTANQFYQSRCERFKKWVNFKSQWKCYVSYSIEDNKFYKL